MAHIDSPTPLPLGKKAANKLRRKKKWLKRQAQHSSLPQISNLKKYKDIDPITVDFNASELAAMLQCLL
jgi:hypothetical protein